MLDDLKDRILVLLETKADQKAGELANSVGSSKTEVNKILYYLKKKGKITQDSRYRWTLVKSGADATSSDQGNAKDIYADTDLACICRYYLACLGYVDTGISTFLASNFGDPDYYETTIIPQASHDLSQSEEAHNLLGRKRSERGRFGLYFGYPTSIKLLESRSKNWQGFMVEPLLLFPVEQEDETGDLIVDLSFPIINQKPFQSFTNADRDMLMNEIVGLEQELGLGEEDGRIEIDEVAMRLQAIRPEWPWKEDINPEVLGEERSPMSEIDTPGIYNRAVILMAEKSPFTQGLEKELRKLSRMPAASYKDTVLGKWLGGNAEQVEDEGDVDQQLIEVLPMNLEQRSAVSTALTRPVTIITGPPGTGKSQVVTNLLANAAWLGKRVLFVSKNNKAVDVVETRVNALGSRPILLRLGSQAYQTRLAEFVLSLMAVTSTPADQEEFADAKLIYERLREERSWLHDEMQEFVELRNDVDRHERELEDIRDRLSGELFAKASQIQIPTVKKVTDSLLTAATLADRGAVSLMAKLLWPLLRNARLKKLATVLRESSDALKLIDQNLPSAPRSEGDVLVVKKFAQQALVLLDDLEQVSSYKDALEDLQQCRSLEDIARKEAAVLDEVAQNSIRLWKIWLKIQPSLISKSDRQKLGKYASLLKMILETGNQERLSQKLYGSYRQMLREISHLLPCWAITSLSANGRIPLEAGIFDLVVFDEASQCDIASALPFLYRAKSVAIIGDAKQLSHISGLQKGQDQSLLERFELLDDYPHWAYSHQSLFALGATQVSSGDIVNLVDHHRSHADIINFSNKEFYEDRLRVATNYGGLRSPNRAEPGIRWVDIKGQAKRPATSGAINEIEASAVVDVIRDLIVNKGYAGSVGVVTPFRAQANAVNEKVSRDTQLSTLLTQRDFLCDTVHKFQGDERDVMIFSPVVSVGISRGSLGFLRVNGNLFNVAITRARAQLIVVGDIAACRETDIGYLSRFAQYVLFLNSEIKETIAIQTEDLGPIYPVVASPESVSEWEHHFYVAAYNAGFFLIPQYPVEKYILDFLLVSGQRKLAVEIDGEKYHRNWTGELCRRDQIRNQRLFELGYDVLRFWVYEVRDDMEGCLKRLREWRDF